MPYETCFSALGTARHAVCRWRHAGSSASVALWLLSPVWAHAAPAAKLADNRTCLAEADGAEHAQHLPEKLLAAIATVETGRYDMQLHRVVPWPWSVNVAGAGYFFSTKQEAVAFVAATQAVGVSSIDVGCMQVNLMYHPDAFADLNAAFDPRANARYAARFLTQLFARTQSWADAAAAYHSQTPGIGAPYAARVSALLSWKLGPAATTLPDTRAALARKVDPYHVMTDAFRDYLVQVELDREGHKTQAALDPGARSHSS